MNAPVLFDYKNTHSFGNTQHIATMLSNPTLSVNFTEAGLLRSFGVNNHCALLHDVSEAYTSMSLAQPFDSLKLTTHFTSMFEMLQFITRIELCVASVPPRLLPQDAGRVTAFLLKYSVKNEDGSEDSFDLEYYGRTPPRILTNGSLNEYLS